MKNEKNSTREFKTTNLILKYLRNPRKMFLFGLGRLIHQIRCIPVENKITKQADLLKQLFNEKSFLLIILDACRYDYFSRRYHKNLDLGCYQKINLKRVWSPASVTFLWIKKCLDGKYDDIKVFSTHPILNSRGIKIHGYKAIDHFNRDNIIDVWDFGWDDKLGTVPPWNVNKAIKDEGLAEKNIVWYLQPHGPWIGKTKLTIPVEEMKSRNEPIEWIVLDKIKKGEFSTELLKKAYEANLELVLNYVNKIMKKWDGDKIIITSDHGEMLGEYGIYFHPTVIKSPELRMVSWLEISKNA